ncbi:MAG: small, acid-soluble spore protein, alpha/beta type [Halanaerobiales bacterium]
MTINKKTVDDLTLLIYKLEAVRELGLAEKVKNKGWGGLSAAETGKLGGYITKKIMDKNRDT